MMKTVSGLLLALTMMLASCSSESEQAVHMQQLQLLLVEAVSLSTMPDKQAQAKATEFVRRAMSGPEMKAMHHDGEAPPAMKAAHELGDAIFSLLEAKIGAGDEQWRSRLILANHAALLRLTGNMQGDALGRFSYSEGRQLAAMRLMSKATRQPETPYAKAASRVVNKLDTLATNF